MVLEACEVVSVEMMQLVASVSQCSQYSVRQAGSQLTGRSEGAGMLDGGPSLTHQQQQLQQAARLT